MAFEPAIDFAFGRGGAVFASFCLGAGLAVFCVAFAFAFCVAFAFAFCVAFAFGSWAGVAALCVALGLDVGFAFGAGLAFGVTFAFGLDAGFAFGVVFAFGAGFAFGVTFAFGLGAGFAAFGFGAASPAPTFFTELLAAVLERSPSG